MTPSPQTLRLEKEYQEVFHEFASCTWNTGLSAEALAEQFREFFIHFSVDPDGNEDYRNLCQDWVCEYINEFLQQVDWLWLAEKFRKAVD